MRVFFQQTVCQIHKNFPILFNQETGEDGSTEGGEGEPNQSGRGFSEFGIIPFILKFCEVTNETFTAALEYEVTTLFYIVSYEVLKAREQEKQIKKMQLQNKR